MVFVLDLTCFLTLMTLLASHPTEPGSFTWQTRSQPHRITQSSSIKNNPEIGDRIRPMLERRNSNMSRVESGKSELQSQVQSARYEETWRHSNDRNSQLQFPSSAFPAEGQPELRQANEAGNGGSSGGDREEFSSVTGKQFEGTKSIGVAENDGAENVNTTYSSHVNCEVENQKNDKLESTPIALEEDAEEFGDVGREYTEKEEINFEEVFRNFRRGSTRKGTNAISTTEKIVRNQSKGSKRPRPGGTKGQGSQIVFPDGYRRQKFTPRGTKCGKKTTFCEHIGEEYPSEYINQVLKREGAMFREFFGKDMISDPNITERIHAPEENSLCPFRQEVVFPRAAKNKDDKWLFVVNQDQYVQGVTVEVCLNPESRCILTEGFPLGYTPYCKQKYIERRLVAIGEDGKPHSDSFRLPSCCSCVVKHETSSRMGSFRTTRNTSPAARTKPSTPSE